jgi:hypothetical protein
MELHVVPTPTERFSVGGFFYHYEVSEALHSLKDTIQPINWTAG